MDYNFGFDPVEANGQLYNVEVVETELRNAYAKIEDARILIRIPRRYPNREKSKVAGILYNRLRKAMMRRPERFLHQNKKIGFHNGQKFSVMGVPLVVNIQNLEGTKNRVRINIDGRDVDVKVGGDIPIEKISRIIKREISRWAYPLLANRIQEKNNIHFKSSIGRLTIRENSTNWGSCTRGSNNLSLNFKLLFLPEGVRDYVIIHELAHTKVRSHSPRFWELVARVMPDYKEKKKFLREKGDYVALGAATREQKDFSLEGDNSSPESIS